MDLKGYHCLADLFGKLNSQEKLEDDFTAIPEGGKLKFFWEKCGHEKIDASSIIERTKQKIRRDVMRRRRSSFCFCRSFYFNLYFNHPLLNSL